jgi:signal transduction histidine kinase
MIGTNALDFVAPEDRENVGTRLRELAARPGGTMTITARVRHKSGEWRLLEGTFTNLLRDSSVRAIVNNYRDVTERESAAAELRSLAAHLQRVREEERTRLARELHDELGQVLTAVTLGVQRAARDVPSATPGVRAELERLDSVLQTIMTSVRRIVEALRPPILDNVGLAAAVTQHARDFQHHTGIACAVTVPRAEPTLEPDIATAVFRILQEALTNVVRHAQATRVEIALRTDTRRLVLTVRDNGRGISDAARTDPEALGLVGMRERAMMLGGTIRIQGRPRRGTTVTLAIPRGVQWRHGRGRRE